MELTGSRHMGSLLNIGAVLETCSVRSKRSFSEAKYPGMWEGEPKPLNTSINTPGRPRASVWNILYKFIAIDEYELNRKNKRKNEYNYYEKITQIQLNNVHLNKNEQK